MVQFTLKQVADQFGLTSDHVMAAAVARGEDPTRIGNFAVLTSEQVGRLEPALHRVCSAIRRRPRKPKPVAAA